MSGGDPAGALQSRLATLPARLAAETAAALRQAGEDVVAEARRLLDTADGPLPSGPGAPPRDAGGRLAASLAIVQDDGDPAVTIQAATPVARDLEYGTRRMAARPFLRPAVDAVRPAAMSGCREALARAARSVERGS